MGVTARVRLGHARRVAREGGPALAGARYRLAPGRATAALTFDDGPDPHWTPLVLDGLARLGVVANFFVVGRRAEAHPALVRRILAEGHGIGSHSSTHRFPAGRPAGQAAADYRLGRRQAERAAGRPVRLFRPPNGRIDLTHGPAIRALGLRTWLWSVDPRDWRAGSTAAGIVAGISPADGDVVLLHDALESPACAEAADRSETVGALPLVVGAYRLAGLRFVHLPGITVGPGSDEEGEPRCDR